jgi:hypothetical protein
MWALRNLVRVSWIRHMSNEEILLHANTYRQLLNVNQTTENIVFGSHIMRAQIHSLNNHSHRKDRGEKRTKSQTTFMVPQYQVLIRHLRGCHFIQNLCGRGHNLQCDIYSVTCYIECMVHYKKKKKA